MKILVTGFDPFGKEIINPAWEAVRLLPKKINEAKIIPLMVPTVFYTSIEVIIAAIEKEKPDAVLMVGQAGGRSAITVERIGINLIDARIEDNAGQKEADVPIIAEGPAAYFATLPIKAIVEGIKAAHIPASVSNTAGTFVCNQVLYGVLHYLHCHSMACQAGFIHIPYLPQQTVNKPSEPSMALDTAVCGLIAALEVIAQQDAAAKEY